MKIACAPAALPNYKDLASSVSAPAGFGRRLLDMLLILPWGSVELLFVRKPFSILSIRTMIIFLLTILLFILLLLCFLLFLLALESSNSLDSACIEEGVVGYVVV